MTWWAEESGTVLAPPNAKARQRWDGIRRDARKIVPDAPAVGSSFHARMPMSGWQVWRRLDKDWVEIVNDRADAPEGEAA